MAPAILPGSIPATADPALATTEESLLPCELDARGSLSFQAQDCTAAPAPATNAALFKIDRRLTPTPLLDGVVDPFLRLASSPPLFVASLGRSTLQHNRCHTNVTIFDVWIKFIIAQPIPCRYTTENNLTNRDCGPGNDHFGHESDYFCRQLS